MIEAPLPFGAALRSRENATLLLRRAAHPWLPNPNPRNRRTVTPEQFRTYHKFAVIRDPWSRVMSWYKNVVRDPVHLKRYGVTADIPLDVFIDRFGGRGMLRPIGWYVRGFDGRVALDRVIDFHDLQSGVAALLADLGQPVEPLGRHNEGGSGTDLGRAYTPRALEAIERIYADEIAQFGFRFKKVA